MGNPWLQFELCSYASWALKGNMMKTMRKTQGLIVAMMLATSVWAKSGAVGTGRYDQQIQQDGIVTLNGSAKVLIDKLDVAKKADKIEHVQGVRDHVQVESNVPDEQLRQQLAEKLRYDRVGYGNAFNAIALNVQNGVVTL